MSGSLTILATSDLHLNLLRRSKRNAGPSGARSFDELWACLRDLRAADPQAVLVDNGDLLQGEVLGEALAQAAQEGQRHPHPMIKAMNLLRYDALSLGNHDFDFGPEFLRQALEPARFSILCANLFETLNDHPAFEQSVILTRRVSPEGGALGVVRIGLIGLIPAEVMIWNADQLRGRIYARRMVDIAQAEAQRLRHAGADVVIALCHSGIGAIGEELDERAADQVADLPGIDAVVAGHTHQLFPGPEFATLSEVDLAQGQIYGTPMVMPGCHGSHIGKIELQLKREAGLGWRVISGRGSLVEVPALSATTPPPQLARICSVAENRTSKILERHAGSSAVPIHSLFALASDCPATRLLAEAKRWHVREALARTPFADLPVLAAASAARSGGRGGPENFTLLESGALKAKHLAELCPFPNTIKALKITGAGLREWLEHSAGTFNRIDNLDRDVPLVDPNRPGYSFDVILGLTYEIDLAGPRRYSLTGGLINPNAHRIRDLCYEGVPVRDQDVFALAVSSFRASGSGAFPGSGTQRHEIYTAPFLIRHTLADYLATHPDWRPSSGPIWRFSRHPGTSAVIQTAPEAEQLLPIPGLEPLRLGESGFLDLRVVF